MASKKGRFFQRLREDYAFRTLFFAALSFALNVAFGLFNGVLGILYLSYWHLSLSAYYILLAFLRGGVLRYHQKRKNRQSETAPSQTSERTERLFEVKNYRSRGILLLFVHLALSIAVTELVFEVNTFFYPGWTIYGVATCAFYNITAAIVHIRRASKTENCSVRAVRCVNLASGTVSILALQAALLSTFNTGEINVHLFNAITGVAVTLFTIVLGIFMIVDAQKIINEMRKEEENDERI